MLPTFLLAILMLLPQGAIGIRGQVVTPTRSTPGRIEVVLEKSGAFLARSFSDNEGYYRFDGLPDGEYTVVVKLEGYEPAREKASFGRNNGATINFMLVPREAAVTDDPGPHSVNVASVASNVSRRTIEDYEKSIEDGRKGRTAQAIERLEAVVKSAPDFPLAHNALATQYQKTNRFGDAEREYNAAVQLDSGYSDPLVNLGSLYIQLAEQSRERRDSRLFGAALDGAVRALNLAIRIQPDSAHTYFLLGTTYYTGGVLSRAEEHLARALELQKGIGPAQLLLANVYMKQQKWAKALEYLDAYLRDNPRASDRERIRQTRMKVAALTALTAPN